MLLFKTKYHLNHKSGKPVKGRATRPRIDASAYLRAELWNIHRQVQPLRLLSAPNEPGGKPVQGVASYLVYDWLGNVPHPTLKLSGKTVNME